MKKSQQTLMILLILSSIATVAEASCSTGNMATSDKCSSISLSYSGGSCSDYYESDVGSQGQQLIYLCQANSQANTSNGGSDCISGTTTCTFMPQPPSSPSSQSWGAGGAAG